MDNGFSISASGLNVSQRRLDVSAHDVANINTENYSERRILTSEKVTGGVRVSGITRNNNSPADLITETKEQIISKNSSGLNAAAFRKKDEMMEALIDLIR